MRILVCSSTFDQITHGPAKFVNIIKDLGIINPSHEIRIITKGSKIEEPNFLYIFKSNYPRFIGVFWEYFDNVKYVLAIRRVRKFYNPDVILFVDVVLGYLPAIIYKDKIKVVGMVNDNGYMDAKLSNFKFNKAWLINFKSKILEYLAVKQMTKVISNSNYLTKKITEEYKVEISNISLLYKGVDFSVLQEKDSCVIQNKGDIKLLFVKNDYRTGGLFDLLVALSLIKDFNFTVFIAGPSEKGWKDINRFYSAANVKLEFLGFAKQSTVFDYMKNCDIFCVPSKREALGVANIEALAIGIPVVSTSAGGIPEVLDDGRAGWMAEPENPSHLAKVISECINNDEERIRKSNHGKIYVRGKFDHFTMIKNLIYILEN